MRNSVLAVSFILIIFSISVYGYPGGAAGYTKKSGTSGCSCHGSSYFNTTVLVQITGPDTVVAGSVTTYTVRVSGGPSTKAGVDIAASTGALTAVTNLKAMSGELTHSTGVSYVSGGVNFTFKYTAPAATSTQTLYATGSSKKYWNFAVNKTVTVISATGVAANDAAEKSYALLGCYPNPFNNQSRLSVKLASDCQVEVNLYDISGRFVQQVFTGNVQSGNKNLPVLMTNQSSGIYIVSISATDNATGVRVLNSSQRLVYIK